MPQVKLREGVMPPIDAELEAPLAPDVQETRNHYINANYVRGYDKRCGIAV